MLNRKSFTLIELLVVIAIIGILSALSLSSLSEARVRARDARRLGDLKTLNEAFELYFSDYGHYPIWTTGGKLSASILTTAVSQYFGEGKVPNDPLKNRDKEYYYQSDERGTNFLLVTALEKTPQTPLTDCANPDLQTLPQLYERCGIQWKAGSIPTSQVTQVTGGTGGGGGGDTISPGNITSSNTESGDQVIILTWVNSTDSDFVGVRIRRVLGATAPADCASGTQVADVAGTPGGDSTYVDFPLINGQQYSYRLCAYDNIPNYASGRILSGIADGTCGNVIFYAGQIYQTTEIGTQCWLAENLNVGTRKDGAINQTNDGVIEKYCYNNDDNICNTDGGLYQWNEAMQYVTTPGAPGICPTGWHIPTHDELTTLERAVCTSGTCATDFPYDTSTSGYRGTNEGDKLKKAGLCDGRTPCGTSGFDALLSGFRNTDSLFYARGTDGRILSSNEYTTSFPWLRSLRLSEARVDRHYVIKTIGFSVRCLKD